MASKKSLLGREMHASLKGILGTALVMFALASCTEAIPKPAPAEPPTTLEIKLEEAELGAAQSVVLAAATSRKPTKPTFTTVTETAGQVAAAWNASTPPTGCNPACTVTAYQVTFRALAGTGTNARFDLAGTVTSQTFDVDGGYYYLFVRAQASNNRWSNSGFRFIIVPAASTTPEPEPPSPPRVTGRAVQSSDWTCNTGEYCSLSYAVDVNGEDGYETEWERVIRPGTGTDTGTGTLDTTVRTTLEIGSRVGVRARQRADADSPWSAWSGHHWHTATAASAAQSSASSLPGAVTDLTAVMRDRGYLLSFGFTDHGGLPVERFQWGPTTFDQGCNDPIFPYQSLQPRNQNAQQSIQVWAGGDAISVRAVNAKGAGSCATIESPDAAPRISLESEWICSNTRYCFKRVTISVAGHAGYQVEYEQKVSPGNASTQMFSGTLPFSSDHSVDIPLDEYMWFHARQRKDANSPWGYWSSSSRDSSPTSEAVPHASVPGQLRNVRAVVVGDELHISFTRRSEGGLPILYYEYGFQRLALCPSQVYIGRLTPSNNNLGQSFVIPAGTIQKWMGLRAVNAKGRGPCVSAEVRR